MVSTPKIFLIERKTYSQTEQFHVNSDRLGAAVWKAVLRMILRTPGFQWYHHLEKSWTRGGGER